MIDEPDSPDGPDPESVDESPWPDGDVEADETFYSEESIEEPASDPVESDEHVHIDAYEKDWIRIAIVHGVYYEPQESTSALGYLVDHTSTLMVVDKAGELKLILPFDLTEEQVAADLARFVG